MVAGLFTSFDPQLKVVPVKGKFMKANTKELQALRTDPDVAILSETLEDHALLMINNRQVMAIIKGVEDSFEELTNINRILIGDGVFELHVDVIDYGILGSNLLLQLGLSTDFSDPIQVYAPRKGERIDLNDPRQSLNQEELFSPGVGFMVKQNKYDSQYVITNLSFARRLFERPNQVSAIEMRLRAGADLQRVKARLQTQLGSRYQVLDRYEQQEDTFKIMQIEKLISYIFLTFILLIACFNIVGSLSMLIIDKKQDAATLHNLGATQHQIRSIFMMEGRMICFIGALIGITIGLLLCRLQQTFGLIRFGNSEGSYIIDAYPVSVHPTDILIILITVIAVGFLSVWYPVRYLTKTKLKN